MGFYDTCRGDLFHPGGFELTKRAIEYCGLKQGAVLADIGCGTGGSARLIAENYPFTVLGVEPSAAMAGGNPEIINASVEKMPFATAFLDCALCECVLSLCDDITAAINELGRVIKPSGHLILSDVYSKSMRFSAAGAIKWLYTRQDFFSFLADCGFEVVLCEDHSRELANMIAMHILNGENCGSYVFDGIDKKNIGYLLIIAQKR